MTILTIPVECKNSKQSWTRNCPKCGKEMTYASKRWYYTNRKYNKLCRGCARKEKGLTYPSRKGCHLTEEHKEKLGASMAIRHKTHGHPMQGQHHTDEAKLKIQQHSSGKNNGMYGKTHSKQARCKMRDARLGKPGPIITPTGLCILRVKRIREISNAKYNGGQIMPSYNQMSCDFFNYINEQLKWNGQYATYNGEYHIKELGYFVDYYEPNLNIVIEWDESTHYDIDGNLREKDKQRQEEIISHLKCKFVRIKEDDFNKEQAIKNIYENTTDK